jgi:hypothetical protein
VTSSPYTNVLSLARQQIAAAQHGDLDTAIHLLQERALALRGARDASDADAPVIREILAIDRQLAGLIRERMIDIRNEAAAVGRGRTALTGYRPRRGSLPSQLDAAR